jgi:Asp-tRNA(Asn)/Glu-tRNA(Gln) amidotransferase A subunit family amidase
MANQYKCINGEMIQMTDEEQAAHNASSVADTAAESLKRLERNGLLAETDWMANADVTMTDAWKTYRQALRDLPAQSGFPDVDFPTKPS